MEERKAVWGHRHPLLATVHLRVAVPTRGAFRT